MTLSREVDANAALNYLAAVEERFRDVPDNYDLFLEYMGQFNRKEIPALLLVDLVVRLLYSSVDLVEGFNAFLPTGWTVKSTLNEGQENSWTVTITNPEGTFLRRFSHVLIGDGEDDERAEHIPSVNEELQMMMNLVQSIRERYMDTPQVYEEFLRLINPRSNIGSRQDIFQAVKGLLHKSPDLVEQFQTLVVED
ncbi:hypothetical protein BKA70DRAFT_1250252 [Coprinopsis sp. MPI-PUGE-AT-0042]|nr:hypothetical protein BKA70DRAFT_1250252 [Coprinopsis sp. MPI-PUGE-AT-0042]